MKKYIYLISVLIFAVVIGLIFNLPPGHKQAVQSFRSDPAPSVNQTRQSSRSDHAPSVEQIRQLAWGDLIPAHLLESDPLQDLNPNVRPFIIQLLNILENMPKREPDNYRLYDMVDKAVRKYENDGINIQQLLAGRKKIRTAVVQELDGQEIKIPGYLLPLEMSGSSTTEFLLVPYVGACIHSPPPPPNQIIHATVSDKKGYQHQKLFEPVYLTGTITVKSSTKDIFLVDGSGSILSSYSMQVKNIIRYKE